MAGPIRWVVMDAISVVVFVVLRGTVPIARAPRGARADTGVRLMCAATRIHTDDGASSPPCYARTGGDAGLPARWVAASVVGCVSSQGGLLARPRV